MTREKIMFRVARAKEVAPEMGVLVPADSYAMSRLRSLKIGVSKLIAATLHKTNSPGFHRLMHQLGVMMADNAPGFEGLNAHDVLKRLQAESGHGCTPVRVRMSAIWPQITEAVVKGGGEHLKPALDLMDSMLQGLDVDLRFPESLSFENMDGATREKVFSGLCDWASRMYWPDISPDRVAEMVRLAPDHA